MCETIEIKVRDTKVLQFRDHEFRDQTDNQVAVVIVNGGIRIGCHLITRAAAEEIVRRYSKFGKVRSKRLIKP